MSEASTVGLDLAKHVFQAHGADVSGKVVFRKRLRRGQVLGFFAAQPACVVATEACRSAHHWARELSKMDHQARLIPPAYVKPFVKRQKHDANDAEAICEAAQRPTMRFVAVKSEAAQANAVVFRARDLLVRQRTQAINSLRGHLGEYGLVVAKGPSHVTKLMEHVEDLASGLPEAARLVLRVLVESLQFLSGRIALLDREIARRAREDSAVRRLATIPGVGPITATAIAALAPPPETFRKGRDFAAWVGLTPSQRSTGGKQKLGATSKMGERTLRRLLIIGASTVIRKAIRQGTPAGSCLGRMLARKPRMLVIVALANKMARTVWALQATGEIYRAPPQRSNSRSRSGGVGDVGWSKGKYGAQSMRDGIGKPVFYTAPRARGCDLDPIRELPYGPAAGERPHQRSNRCQHLTTRNTFPKIPLASAEASTDVKTLEAPSNAERPALSFFVADLSRHTVLLQLE